MSSARRLNIDYVHRFESLARFFAGDPASAEAWRQSIARAQHHPRARDELVAVLLAQQASRETPAAAREAARALTDPTSIAIVTGQQAGLFGGPLYTLIKALATVRLAEQVTRQHGVPAVPLFWIDADDHDWDEVSDCQVLDRELVPQRVAVPKPDGGGTLPVASVALPPAVSTAIEALGLHLSPTDFTDALLADLAAIYRPGVGMAAAFGQWLDRLLGPHGLVVFDAADPAAKPLAQGVFERELETMGRTADLAARAGEALETLGYQAQVAPQRGQPALFHVGHARLPIRRRDDTLTIGETIHSKADLLNEIRNTPARFSPNVLLRPIVQDTLFPTAAYVAGPSELVYLGQLRDIYAHFDVPMPLIVPRPSVTILDSAATRFLARHALKLDELRARDEARLNRLLEGQLPTAVEEGFVHASAALQDRLTELIRAVPAIDPTLEGAARTTLTKMDRELQTLRAKVIQAAKRRDETLRRQFTRTRAQAFPDGQLQERALGFVYFLNRYGPALVDQLRTDLPLETSHHWVLTP
ncbi:MAG: bacillithiol biosynthesis cysteine-adding enzyme BshC [Luteitalea sp.]|nr:bacillithiol biosynthesis cysteine-adding enzyme BshC [Luteitalea sp.]